SDIDSDIIKSLSGAIYTIQNLDSGQTQTTSSVKKISITDPKQEKWDLETWEENIPDRFDSITTIFDDGSTTTWNKYETEITIEIPSRFSLYNGLYSNSYNALKDTQFNITGMLITPFDGMVYDTSNKELFKKGAAKSPGKYFYYDSDDDGFYEIVYVLANPEIELERGQIMGKEVYKVKSIGFNYDGEHDFSPYKKVNRKVVSKTDFDQLEAEGTQKYGASLWAYNFKKLKSIDLLFPDDPFDGYEPQDHIFEISKLVRPSQFNSKFPELFYEVRHRAYADAWKVYKKQLTQDIAEQVFMTLTASAVSGFLQWIPFGIGQVLGTLAYIAVYTLLTKFFMDMKRHQAQAVERANTYIPISMDDIKPKSLNERIDATHGYWEESTIAALLGHPGAYYTEVNGEANNQLYTAYAIVSPPNILRDNPDKNWKGFSDYIWNNLWDASRTNPDLMIGLDFDAVNLDYFLLTTELSSLNEPDYTFLPSYNRNPNYTFEASAYNDLYNTYRYNTIGYLQQEIAKETNGDLSLIKPVIIGGVPQYIFVDGTDSFIQITMPVTHLYQPVVVSQELAKNIQNEGTITVNIKTPYTSNTKGISHETTFPEAEIYPSKVPLSSHGFEYPITFIKIELIEESPYGVPISIRDITLTSDSEGFDDFFYVELGNIYFEDNIDKMFVSGQNGFNYLISSGQMSASTKKYYRLTIKFDMIIPDSGSKDHERLALSQATAYGIMDYMNQYTFAHKTAEMISEIGYTETLTVRSSVATAAGLILGGWATSGLKHFIGKAGSEAAKITLKSVLGGLAMGAVKFAFVATIGTIKEMFEEIIIDGFLETWGEKIIIQAGGNEEQAFWFTSLLTSGREGLSGIRSVAMKAFGKIGGIRTWFTKHLATSINSEVYQNNERSKKINEEYKINKKDEDFRLKEDKVNSWKKIIGSGLLGLLLSVVTPFFTGGLLFSNFMSTMSTVSHIEGFYGDILGRYQTLKANARKHGRNTNLQAMHELKKLMDQQTNPAKSKKPTGIEQDYLEKNGEPITDVKNNPEISNPMSQDVSTLKEKFSENLFDDDSPGAMDRIWETIGSTTSAMKHDSDHLKAKASSTKATISKAHKLKTGKSIQSIGNERRVVKISMVGLNDVDTQTLSIAGNSIDPNIWKKTSSEFSLPTGLTSKEALNYIKIQFKIS
ncbi:hypothetical protein LCGC14_1555860, partial [marine sediment metagenome]